MKGTRFTLRLLALFLSLSLALPPSPAFALRPIDVTERKSGLEELHAAVKGQQEEDPEVQKFREVLHKTLLSRDWGSKVLDEVRGHRHFPKYGHLLVEETKRLIEGAGATPPLEDLGPHNSFNLLEGVMLDLPGALTTLIELLFQYPAPDWRGIRAKGILQGPSERSRRRQQWLESPSKSQKGHPEMHPEVLKFVVETLTKGSVRVSDTSHDLDDYYWLLKRLAELISTQPQGQQVLTGLLQQKNPTIPERSRVAITHVLEPQSTTGLEEGIDLNQPLVEGVPDLEQPLARQLRSVLPNGVVKGIIRWRREKGPFERLEQLTNIPGIKQGSLSQLWPKFKPILQSLAEPVRMIFSDDKFRSDGIWVADRMRELLQDVERSRPVVFWFERKSLGGLPIRVEDVEAWVKSFTQQPPDPEALHVLREHFKQMQKEDVPVSELMRDGSDPFLQEIWREIESLRKEGWNIRLKAEEFSWEAYRNIAIWSAWAAKMSDLLTEGDGQGALHALASGYPSLSQSGGPRDGILGGRLVQDLRGSSEAVHLVLCAPSRAPGMRAVLSSLGIQHQAVFPSAVMPTREFSRATYIEEGFPSPDSPRGRRILTQDLLRVTLYQLIEYQAIVEEHEQAVKDTWYLEVDRWIGFLSDAQLARWLEEIVPRATGGLRSLGFMTLKWLRGALADSRSIQGEADLAGGDKDDLMDRNLERIGSMFSNPRAFIQTKERLKKKCYERFGNPLSWQYFGLFGLLEDEEFFPEGMLQMLRQRELWAENPDIFWLRLIEVTLSNYWLHHLEATKRPLTPSGEVDPRRIEAAAQGLTELLFFMHASAVLVALQTDLLNGHDLEKTQERIGRLDQLIQQSHENGDNMMTVIFPSLAEMAMITFASVMYNEPASAKLNVEGTGGPEHDSVSFHLEELESHILQDVEVRRERPPQFVLIPMENMLEDVVTAAQGWPEALYDRFLTLLFLGMVNHLDAQLFSGELKLDDMHEGSAVRDLLKAYYDRDYGLKGRAKYNHLDVRVMQEHLPRLLEIAHENREPLGPIAQEALGGFMLLAPEEMFVKEPAFFKEGGIESQFERPLAEAYPEATRLALEALAAHEPLEELRPTQWLVNEEILYLATVNRDRAVPITFHDVLLRNDVWKTQVNADPEGYWNSPIRYRDKDRAKIRRIQRTLLNHFLERNGFPPLAGLQESDEPTEIRWNEEPLDETDPYGINRRALFRQARERVSPIWDKMLDEAGFPPTVEEFSARMRREPEFLSRFMVFAHRRVVYVRKFFEEAYRDALVARGVFNAEETAIQARTLADRIFISTKPIQDEEVARLETLIEGIRLDEPPKETGLEEYRLVPISEEPKLGRQLRIEERLKEYQNRLVENSRGQRFLVKFRTEAHPSSVRLGHTWADRNDPIREYVASQVGLALGANAAEIVIPSPAERERLAQWFPPALPDGIYLTRLSYDIKPDDPAFRQSYFKKAFTRALIALAVFPRKYNFHTGNLSFSANGTTPFFFDHDQAFNPVYTDIESYTRAFIRSYFDTPYSRIFPNDLLDRIEPEELSAAVREIEEEDFNGLHDRVESQLAQSAFGGSLPDWADSEINAYFQRLKQWQGTVREDVVRFFEAIFSHPRDLRWKEEPVLTMEDIRTALASPTGLEETPLETLKRVVDRLEQDGAEGEFRKGAILDLRHLPPDVPVFFIGDLHGQVENLREILQFLDHRPDSRGHLVILGDAVHPEGDYSRKSVEMEPSHQIIKAILRRMAKEGPLRVHYILGNHDPLRGGVSIQGFQPGLVFENSLNREYGESYVSQYEAFLRASPLVVIGKGFIASHATPGEPVTLEELISLHGVPEEDPIVQRFLRRIADAPSLSQLDDFREAMGQEGALLIQGHNHLVGGMWHHHFLDQNRLILYAGRQTGYGSLGFAKMLNGTLELIELKGTSVGAGLEEVPRIPRYFDGWSDALDAIGKIVGGDLARWRSIEIDGGFGRAASLDLVASPASSPEDVEKMVADFINFNVGYMWGGLRNGPFAVEAYPTTGRIVVLNRHAREQRAGSSGFSRFHLDQTPWRNLTPHLLELSPSIPLSWLIAGWGEKPIRITGLPLESLAMQVLKVTMPSLTADPEILLAKAQGLATAAALMGAQPGDRVIEFGPREGTLAIFLALSGLHVTVYEHPATPSLTILTENYERFREAIERANGALHIRRGDVTTAETQRAIEQDIQREGPYAIFAAVDVFRPGPTTAPEIPWTPEDGIENPEAIEPLIRFMAPFVTKAAYLSHPDSPPGDELYMLPGAEDAFSTFRGIARVQVVSSLKNTAFILLKEDVPLDKLMLYLQRLPSLPSAPGSSTAGLEEVRGAWSGEPLFRDFEKEGYVQTGTVGPHNFQILQKGSHKVLLKTRESGWFGPFIERAAYEVAKKAHIETSPVWLVRESPGKIRAAIEYWEDSEVLLYRSLRYLESELVFYKSELVRRHPELAEVVPTLVNYHAWIPRLARPGQFIGSDILRQFMSAGDSLDPKQVLIKRVVSPASDEALYEARFIDFEHSLVGMTLSSSTFQNFLLKEKELLAHYALVPLEQLANITDSELSDMVATVFPEELSWVAEGQVRSFGSVKEMAYEGLKNSRDILLRELPRIRAAISSVGLEEGGEWNVEEFLEKILQFSRSEDLADWLHREFVHRKQRWGAALLGLARSPNWEKLDSDKRLVLLEEAVRKVRSGLFAEHQQEDLFKLFEKEAFPAEMLGDPSLRSVAAFGLAHLATEEKQWREAFEAVRGVLRHPHLKDAKDYFQLGFALAFIATPQALTLLKQLEESGRYQPPATNVQVHVSQGVQTISFDTFIQRKTGERIPIRAELRSSLNPTLTLFYAGNEKRRFEYSGGDKTAILSRVGRTADALMEFSKNPRAWKMLASRRPEYHPIHRVVERAAGLEESVERYVRRLRQAVRGDLLRELRANKGPLDINFDRAVRAPNRHWALAKGAGDNWWIHLHLNKGYSEQGLLFRLKLSPEGKIVALENPLAEIDSSVGVRGFVPVEPFLSRRQASRLLEAAWHAIQRGKIRDLLEEKIAKRWVSLFILGQLARPRRLPVYEVISREELTRADEDEGSSPFGRLYDYGFVQRLDISPENWRGLLVVRNQNELGKLLDERDGLPASRRIARLPKRSPLRRLSRLSHYDKGNGGLRQLAGDLQAIVDDGILHIRKPQERRITVETLWPHLRWNTKRHFQLLSTGLEEVGRWSPERAERLWKKLESEGNRKLAKLLGLTVEDVEYAFLLDAYKGLVIPLVDEMVRSPHASRAFFSELISKYGDPSNEKFWKSLASRGRKIGGRSSPVQAILAAFHRMRTFRERWLITMAAMWEPGTGGSPPFAYTLVTHAKRLNGEDWKAWLGELQKTLHDLDKRRYALVQWDLRNRFRGKRGFTLLHGSKQLPMAPGRMKVQEGFVLTWNLDKAKEFATKQLAIVRVPFDRVIRTAWLEGSSYPEILISKGSMEVLASLPPKSIRGSPIPDEPELGIHPAEPIPEWWTYRGNQLPKWAKELLDHQKKSGLEETEEKGTLLRPLPHPIAPNPETATADDIAQYLKEAFGVQTHLDHPLLLPDYARYECRQKDFPETAWTMNRILPFEKHPVFDHWEEIPVRKLVYPMKVLPVVSSPALTGSAMVSIGFVEDIHHPVAIKVLHLKEDGAFPPYYQGELRKAQAFSRLGIGPRFYGVIRLNKRAIGYAMQVVPGEVIYDEIPWHRFFEKWTIDRRARIAGLFPSDFVGTPSGHLVTIDAPSASVRDQRLFEKFIRSTQQKSAGLEEGRVLPMDEFLFRGPSVRALGIRALTFQDSEDKTELAISG